MKVSFSCVLYMYHLSQDLEIGWPKLIIVKFLDIQFFKGNQSLLIYFKNYDHKHALLKLFKCVLYACVPASVSYVLIFTQAAAYRSSTGHS